MEPLGSEESVAGREGLVSRAVRMPDPPRPRAVLGAAAAPRTFWSAPGEPTVAPVETTVWALLPHKG